MLSVTLQDMAFIRAISHWREYTIHIDTINIARYLWWSATIKFKWCLLLVIARLHM